MIPLVNLDLAELGISIAGIAKAGYQHPLQDRAYADIVRVGLLAPLGLDAQIEQRGDHSADKSLLLRMLDGLGGEIVLDDD